MIRIILNNKDIVIPIFKALDLNSELSRDLVREARGRDRREKALTRVGDKKELVSPPRVQEKGFEALKKISL
jgi:hypothetical protein